MLSKAIEYLLMSLVSTMEEAFLCCTCLELFLGCSLLWFVTPCFVCYALFCLLRLVTPSSVCYVLFCVALFLRNVLICKFTEKNFLLDFVTWASLLQSGPALIYYRVGQVLLQNKGAFMY